jgi:hypothetical protein
VAASRVAWLAGRAGVAASSDTAATRGMAATGVGRDGTSAWSATAATSHSASTAPTSAKADDNDCECDTPL